MKSINKSVTDKEMEAFKANKQASVIGGKETVGFDPSGKLIYAPNRRERRGRKVRLGNNSTGPGKRHHTVYDSETGKPIRTIFEKNEGRMNQEMNQLNNKKDNIS